MFRPVLPPSPVHSLRWKEYRRWLLASLTIWICVSVIVRYGYYADRRMVLGPSSSRLMKTSSFFVEQVEVRDGDKKGIILYGFSDKPELSLESNWSIYNNVIVESYSRKGFSLWLNKGSRIRMRLETQSNTLNQFQMVLIKGERKHQTLLPKLTTSTDILNLSSPLNGKEAEYMIKEDDEYYLGVVNTKPRSIIMKITVNITSKVYDFSKATNICSTVKGSCQLMLLFLKTQYVVVTGPDSGDSGGSFIDLSFMARITTYIAILGFMIVIIFLVLKFLGACDSEESIVETTSRQVSETEPVLPEKPVHVTYGTLEEDEEDGSSSTCSEDLYDAKLCVICYDDQRNCFFVPCGHCATCYDCAQRIMEREGKICPICRRLIHKVRRLFTP